MAHEFDPTRWEQSRRDRHERNTAKDRNRRLLIDCYRSGQISERQWEQHISEDPVLAAM